MTILGWSLAEIAALLSVGSIVIAAIGRFYHQFRKTISAPLIEAMDKLRVEITQLDYQVVSQYNTLKSQTQKLDERLRVQENSKEGKGYDHCGLAKGG